MNEIKCITCLEEALTHSRGSINAYEGITVIQQSSSNGRSDQVVQDTNKQYSSKDSKYQALC